MNDRLCWEAFDKYNYILHYIRYRKHQVLQTSPPETNHSGKIQKAYTTDLQPPLRMLSPDACDTIIAGAVKGHGRSSAGWTGHGIR